jgi:hypothetical protein
MGTFRAGCGRRCSFVHPKRAALLLAACLGCGRAPESVLPSRAAFTPGARPYLNMPADDQGEKPALLSQTGAFADTRTLTPAAGLLPYDLNVPSWSDGADKPLGVTQPEEVWDPSSGGNVGRRRGYEQSQSAT